MRKNKILALIFTFLLIFSNAAPGFIYAAESSFGGEPSIISGEMLEHADEIVDDVDITQSTQTESDTLDVDETVDSDLGEDGDSSTEQLDPENQDPEIAPPAGEQEEIEKEDEIGDAMENIPEVENISPEVANIELFDTNPSDIQLTAEISEAGQTVPSDIQLTAEISEAGQTVTINKYFSNSYTVDRGDGSSIVTLTADTTHSYTTTGEYQITLSLTGTATRWTFGSIYKPLVPKAGTTANNIYLSSMPSLADYFGTSATSPGDNFFRSFNGNGALTSLPENSFNTSNIITVGNYFFSSFNFYGGLTSLPENSFDTSNITTVGYDFFAGFNNNGALTSLPVGSFDTSNITTVGNSFFAGFNFYGGLTSLPENSFNTSNITTVGNYFFQNFNGNGVLTSLPENSFNTSNIITVGNYFFSSFNAHGALTSLPENSFNISNITTVGSNFFGAFNTYGALISIPENSFDTSSNITTVGDYFFYSFNFYGALISIPENSFDTSNITTVGDYFFAGFNNNGALTSLPVGSFDTLNITTVGNEFFAGFNYNGALTSLPEGSFNTSNITTVGNHFFLGFNDSGALTLLPAESFDIAKITSVGNSFFSSFNSNGALTSLPEGSFNTSNITTVGNEFFASFNYNGALTSLPAGSFDTSNITTVENSFFSSFNSYGALTSLPEGSFDTSSITTVGANFFWCFNSNGALTSLPEGSFNTSNITTVGNDFFYSFNGNGALIKANTGIAIKNPTMSSIIFHYQNEGGMSSDSIPANSNFEYYSTTPLDLNLANFPSNIQITAEITESGQTVTINKYFKNIYTINWGDGVGNFSYKNITHSYSTPGTYTITLALTQENERWQFGGKYTLVPKNGTTAANIYLSSIPSLAEYFGESAEEPGDNFFRNFNSNGALTSIPENSFDTSNITTVGDYFFSSFNSYGALISIPENSFDTSNITTVGDYFFSSFNSNGALTSLPKNSFNISNITTVGNNFFSYFNLYGALTSLPAGSFDTSNIITVGNNFFSYFNLYGALTSLPAGSFDTSNIITVGNYFFSYFNQGGALTSLPAGSFDTSNIKIVGNYFFDNFNGGGKLTKSKNGVTIKNITDSPITFHYRDGDYGYNNTDNVQKNESATYSTVALTPADFPSNIQLIAEITQANQTVAIGNTFRNIHTIDWGDGSWDLNGVQHPHRVTHSYSTPGTYTITVALTEGDERWQFSSYGGQALVPKDQTTAANVYLSSMPSLAEYFGESAENPGDNFFQFFNFNGALTSLPVESFDTSKITIAGNNFFYYFNYNGALIKANTGIAIYNPSLNDVTFHYKNADGSVGSGTITAGSSFEYYPMMTSYTISFKDTDGSLVASKKVVEGTTVIAPADPERESYTFIGWYTDAELTTEYNFATPVTTDLTLYAKWEKIATTPSENNTTSSSGGGGGFGTNSKSENSTSTHTSAPEGPSFPKTEIDTTSILQNLLKEQLEKEVSTPMQLEKLAQVVASAQQAPVSQELKDAYIYAYLKGITTMDTVESAELDRGLTRAELAKMMVVVAQNLGKEKKVDTSVSYADTASVTGDLADYIQQAYQMQIMGIDADGNPLENFNPHGEVSRAEFATVLSRVLFGDQYNQGTEDYYSKHLEVLKNKGILQQDNPHIKELRGWVMLMLMRAEQLQN